MLLHIPAALSPEQVSQMRTVLEAAARADGRETVGLQAAKVKRNQQLPEGSPLRLQLGQIVLPALAAHPLHPPPPCRCTGCQRASIARKVAEGGSQAET